MQTKKTTQLVMFFLLVFCSNLWGQQVWIHISPMGNDQHEGTEHKPIQTIERGRQMVEEIKNKYGHNDTIFVVLHEGVYRLKQGIVLNTNDSGTNKFPVVYQNFKEDKVVISGSVPLESYKKVSKDHILYNKNRDGTHSIIEIDLVDSGLTEFNKIRLSGFSGNEKRMPFTLRELYFDGKPMPLSRWPNGAYSVFTNTVKDSSTTIKRTGIIYTDSHISNWEKEPNILLHGYWKHLWADAYEDIYQIDTIQKIIWLNPPYNHYYFGENKPFSAYNVISEIDKPGEWAYDYLKKKIYFYPPDDLINGSLELSVCKTPLLQLNKVSWVTFRGIHFQMGAGDGLHLENSNHINIEDCEINGFAGDGIIINGGHNNSILSCHIKNMGRGAIKVSGGNRANLQSAEFLIDNCHIHHLSRIDHTYTPGIWVDGVGTQISHCKIHDVASSAMRINGNNHLIEYNEMFHVVTESDDQGAIDMWGDPTYRGNVFRYNYIYDVGPYTSDEINAHTGRAGIRFDDAISGNLVYSNIFKNCSGGNFGAIQIHGGKENLIWNNLFYQCSSGISFTPWNYDHWMRYNKKSLEYFEENRFVYISNYPEMVRINEDLNKNTIIQNIFLECQQTFLRKPETIVHEDNLVMNNKTGTKDLDKDDYYLENVPDMMTQIEFEPIPFKNIGLRNKN